MFNTLILFTLVHISTALVVNLNDTDYARLPPLYHLDNYEECFDEPDAIFCFTEFVLVSDEPSELLTLVQKISESYLHYNHTLLYHGYCMKKTCSKFYNGSGTDEDLKVSLEACTNETIYNKYKLKTRLTNDSECSHRDRDHPIDNVDIAVAVVCIMILLVNIVASLCDRCLEERKNVGALRYLYCFSIYRNWKKFTALPGEGQDPRIKSLKGVHGIRSLVTFAVVIGHTFFTVIILNINTKYIEDMQQLKISSVLIAGTVIMQLFFVVSSFLLVYNWLITSEKVGTSLWMLPQQIIIRWCRLTPSYALVLALTATWFGRIAYGPYWKKIIYSEMNDCRRVWWHHILYINNFYRSNCMPQSWYLACDTQLYIIGVIVFLTCKTAASRKLVLSLLFLSGIIATVLITYYERLYAFFVANLKTSLNLFVDNPEFNQVYVKPYTNLSGYAIGMAFGYIIYSWQQNGGDPKKFQKYKYLYWSSFLMAGLCNFSTYIFFVEGPGQPIYVHLIYAAFLKPVFGLITGIILAGIVIQFEGFYRAICEWRPFTYTGRLCYCAYILHVAFVRAEAASITSVQSISEIAILLRCTKLVIGTFITAFFFWMLVESPFSNLTGQIFKKLATPSNKEKNDEVCEMKKAEEANGTDMTETQVKDGTVVVKDSVFSLLRCTKLVIGTFIAAFFFWMLVESPFSNLTGQVFKKLATPANKEKNEEVCEMKKAEEANGTDMTETQVEDGTVVVKEPVFCVRL